MEVDGEAVTRNDDVFGDFIEWLKEQTERLDLIYKYQFSRVMYQRGFEKKQDGNAWYFHGIKLKGN